MKLAKRFSIILFVVGILLAMSISASAWEVVGSGNNKENATEVEIINMGGVWTPVATTGNPKFNVIIPQGATDVEIKINGLVRQGTWTESDTSNNYIIQFGFASDSFAGENEVTITATYPTGTKSATGKYIALSRAKNGYSENENAVLTHGGYIGKLSILDINGRTYTTALEGSMNSTPGEGYMVFTGPQTSGNARIVRPFNGTATGAAERWINFRYYTSSDDAELSFNYTGECANANPVVLPAEAGKWFTIGVWQPHIKYPLGDGTYERYAFVYANGEYIGRLSHASFAKDSGAKINFNPGQEDEDFIAFDYYMCHYIPKTNADDHTSFSLGVDAFDADEGFVPAAFEADTTKTFPVGTRAVAIKVSILDNTHVANGDGTLDSSLISLYKDGELVDPEEVSFSVIKDTTDTTNGADWYIIVAATDEFAAGYYTVAADPNQLTVASTTPLVTVGDTFRIGAATPAVTEYAVADNGTAISGSNVAIKANISAPAAAAATARVFFAVYNEDGALVAAKVAAVTAGSTVPYESSVAVDDATGLTVKAFVFDTANLKPLTTTATTVFAQ